LNVANAEIYNIISDGTVDQFNPNFTANDYVTRANRHLRSNLLRKYVNNLTALYLIGFYIDEMLLSCTFQNENCSIDDFMPQFDFNYGLCWRFNMGRGLQGKVLPIRTSGQVGWKNGLQLELYTCNSKIQEKFSITRGFRVLVFNKSAMYPIAEDIGIDVSTGQATNIGIRRTITNHLPAPFSNCLPNDVSKINWAKNEVLQFTYDNFVTGQYYWSTSFWDYVGNWTWNWTVNYFQSKCVKLCFQKYLFKNCGCYDLTLPRSPKVSQVYARNACVSTSQINCENKFGKTFYNDPSLIGGCYDSCPMECTEIMYDLTVSSSSYPTEWYASVLANNSNFNTVINTFSSQRNASLINYSNDFAELKNAIARVNVYYEDLRFTEVNENPAMDEIALLGTLGGNLGLFLGMLNYFELSIQLNSFFLILF
jgi:hypothetical protein